MRVAISAALERANLVRYIFGVRIHHILTAFVKNFITRSSAEIEEYVALCARADRLVESAEVQNRARLSI